MILIILNVSVLRENYFSVTDSMIKNLQIGACHYQSEIHLCKLAFSIG